MARAGLTRERIVAEAAVVADEVGLDRLTLAAVAVRFGVKLPSLYKHIDGIDALRRDLAVFGMGVFGDTLRAAAVGRVRRDALSSMAEAYRRFATDRPGLYAATVRAADPDDAEHVDAVLRALDGPLGVMRSYGVADSEAIHGIRITRASLHGFVALDTAGGFGLPEDVDESFRRLVDGLDRYFSELSEESPTR